MSIINKGFRDPDYDGLNKDSTNLDRLNIIFKQLLEANGMMTIRYTQLGVTTNSHEKTIDAMLIATGLVDHEQGSIHKRFELKPHAYLELGRFNNFSEYNKSAIESHQIKSQKDEKKENLEMENLISQNQKLLEDLIELPKIKKQRNALFIFSIIETIATIITIIWLLKGKS